MFDEIAKSSVHMVFLFNHHKLSAIINNFELPCTTIWKAVCIVVMIERIDGTH